MHRYFLDYLLTWKDKPNRKPLIIRGARQVGKSTVATLLAENSGLELLTLNFEQKPDLSGLFKSLEPQKILQLLEVEFNKVITPGKTLLFLDELQAAESSVFLSLRYFYEQLPGLHVLAAGSLLEFTLAEPTFSMPVGRIEYAYLGPLSFEEFLLALGHEKQLAYLKKYTLTESIPFVIHRQLLDLVRTYMIVGGMPEVVRSFAQQQSLLASEPIKQFLLNTFQDDFAKYGKRVDVQRLRKVFQRLPYSVGKKVKYVQIDAHERTKDLANALQKLCLARLGFCVHATSANHLPLAAEINEKAFKMLFLDVGLWTTAMGVTAECTQIDNLLGIQEGAWCEQFIGQQLLYSALFYEPPQLYYWLREKVSSPAEVDYLIAHQGSIIPIEVKAGKTGRLRSLAQFLMEKKYPLAVRFNDAPPLLEKISLQLTETSLHYDLLSIPFYLVGQVKRLLGEMPKFQERNL